MSQFDYDLANLTSAMEQFMPPATTISVITPLEAECLINSVQSP